MTDDIVQGSGWRIAFGDAGLAAAFEAECYAWSREDRIARLWAGDASLWTGADEAKWLGWLRIAEREQAELAALQAFGRDVQAGGYRDVVLLGMGGSSLGPEVLAETFGVQPGWPRLHVLDSTDPAQIRRIEAGVDLDRTLFIVSSKSGGTLEPNILLDYFQDRVRRRLGAERAGDRFVAVTDPGSSLERRATADGFAHIFYGEPSIGGRYSVLSKFGLVPAAAAGLDVARLLEGATAMARACGPDVPVTDNPGAALGLALGLAAAKFGRDKVTFAASPAIADLGAWLEQLVAESTGKEGRGLIPVDGEPLAPADQYAADRLFAYLELAGATDPTQRAAAEALEAAGHPVVRLVLPDTYALGAEFFRWEIATAVAGAVIGVNPFDQPDVEASKEKTRALTAAYEQSQAMPSETPWLRTDGVSLFADPRDAAEIAPFDTLAGCLRRHLGRVRPGDYVALLAYLDRSPAHLEALTALRAAVASATEAATCVGFGPRFLHSTGQAYKGGPDTGVFLQITCDATPDLDVPGHRYSFGVVIAAQARGDLEVLVERGRRALRVHLAEPEAGLAALANALSEALATG